MVTGGGVGMLWSHLGIVQLLQQLGERVVGGGEDGGNQAGVVESACKQASQLQEGAT